MEKRNQEKVEKGWNIVIFAQLGFEGDDALVTLKVRSQFFRPRSSKLP